MLKVDFLQQLNPEITENAAQLLLAADKVNHISDAKLRVLKPVNGARVANAGWNVSVYLYPLLQGVALGKNKFIRLCKVARLF